MKALYFPLFLSLVMAVYGQEAEYPPESSIPVSSIPGMVWINGGTFVIGSPANERGRSNNEGPQRQTTISSFYMGRYEVTQSQYEAVMGGNPSYFPVILMELKNRTGGLLNR